MVADIQAVWLCCEHAIVLLMYYHALGFTLAHSLNMQSI